MAIRRRRLAKRVVGCSRKPSTIQRAKRLGAIDEGTTRLAEAVAGAEMVIVATPVDDIVQVVHRAARGAKQRGAIDWGTTDLRRAVAQADLVVLATPVDLIIPLAKRAARAMPAGSILTDVGSSKGAIVRALERSLPRGIRFIGGHPLAGSEQHGIAAADATLFDGSLCLLTATPRANRRALQAVKRLWSSVARRVVVVSPQRHDQLLAATSHLPHLLAYSLMASTPPDELLMAPRSFLDMTRIAKSDPDLWDDILLSNRTALSASMARFDRQWKLLRKLVVGSHREALRRALHQAKHRRDAISE
jgi:prephenate dehydrogenase